MTPRSTDMSGFVTALVPMLSRSLAEEFNVFRVMHHGTHEKQLSNVFEPSRLLCRLHMGCAAGWGAVI
ncbi:hypothetical protein GCM10025781_27130 [Kocuria gwangalliensis]|uniref:Uncharacterized protein n=1 Tax=Kocuria gwangalliensis TaxID=501592 RepID=A0ABP8XHY9_9MICC